MRSFLLLPFCAVLGACHEPSGTEPAASNDSDLTAKSTGDDAVGALTRDGKEHCVGTLIAPDLVLTARSCALDDGRNILDLGAVEFQVGKESVRADRLVTCEPIPNIDLGPGKVEPCEIAVLHLATSIKGVTPLAPEDVSTGCEDDVCAATMVTFAKKKRTATPVTLLAALSLSSSYGEADAVVEEFEFALKRALSKDERAVATMLYEDSRATGQFYAAAAGEQSCSADRGAPVLVEKNGRIHLVAVTDRAAGAAACGPNLGFYFRLDDHLQRLAADVSKDTCGAYTDLGTCEGNVAVRCSSPQEGVRRLTRIDCAVLNQRCVAATSSKAVACGGAS